MSTFPHVWVLIGGITVHDLINVVCINGKSSVNLGLFHVLYFKYGFSGMLSFFCISSSPSPNFLRYSISLHFVFQYLVFVFSEFRSLVWFNWYSKIYGSILLHFFFFDLPISEPIPFLLFLCLSFCCLCFLSFIRRFYLICILKYMYSIFLSLMSYGLCFFSFNIRC